MTQRHNRKRTFCAAIASGLLGAFSLPAFAIDYYVSPDGDDWSDGESPSTAWRTISRANTVMRAGDTVYIRGGEYLDDPIADRM